MSQVYLLSGASSGADIFFTTGWERTSSIGGGGSPSTTITDNDYISTDYGPGNAGDVPIVEVVADEKYSGDHSCRVNYLSGYGGNGPDFRIGNRFSAFGRGELSTVYIRWRQKFSSNFYFRADHKMMILGRGTDFRQDIYLNTRPGPGSDPTTGRMWVGLTPPDTGFESNNISITRNAWHTFEAKIVAGTNGSVEMRFDGTPITWNSFGFDIMDVDTGPSVGWCKWDTTFNGYDDPLVQAATPFYEWVDDWAWAEGDWIGV